MRMILNINENNDFMKHNMLKILTLIATMLFTCVSAHEYIKVADHKVEVDGNLCYSVRKGYSWRDTTKWVPYCGVIKNLYHEEGFEYSLMIDKFDIQADTICVVRTIASYRPRKSYKKPASADSTQNK